MRRISAWVLVILGIISFSGCTFIFQKGRRTDFEKIEELTKQLDEFRQVKQLLEERLKQEIADKQVRLAMAKKGLVITFVTDVLFDSGKAKIKSEVYPALDKVAQILAENIPENEVGIEGHTDNEPIRYSGWKSNWELSTARALSVLHYLIDKKAISPIRISAIGYGEHRPVASNSAEEGRQLNRRVEIVILPKVTKIKETTGESESSRSEFGFEEPSGNFK